ncbi:MAG: SWIM zinc finger family protein [Thermoproteota archaeon]
MNAMMNDLNPAELQRIIAEFRQLRAKYHLDDPARLERGIRLALAGAVWRGRSPNGGWEVRGYIVGPQGRCTCPDFQKRSQGNPWFCKHATACFIAEKLGLVQEKNPQTSFFDTSCPAEEEVDVFLPQPDEAYWM